MQLEKVWEGKSERREACLRAKQLVIEMRDRWEQQSLNI